jgi:hypothetical protein
MAPCFVTQRGRLRILSDDPRGNTNRVPASDLPSKKASIEPGSFGIPDAICVGQTICSPRFTSWGYSGLNMAFEMGGNGYFSSRGRFL